MFPNFLPSNVTQLSEKTSIELAASLQQVSIATPLSSKPIQTCFAQQGKHKTPVLLLHGFDSSVMEFRRLLPRLAADRETWALDLLGFGFTERFVELNYSTDNIKAHLKAFWEKMINRPVVLVGVSMGGATAIDFALTYPEIVESLILIDSAGLAQPPSLKKIMFPPLDRLATLFLANAWVRKSVSRNAYCDKALVNEDSLSLYLFAFALFLLERGVDLVYQKWWICFFLWKIIGINSTDSDFVGVIATKF